MSMSAVSAVVINGVSRGQALLKSGEVGLGSFQHQMVVIAHQAKHEETNTEVADSFLQTCQEPTKILFIVEQSFPPIPPTADPAAGHMVNRSWKFNAWGSCHARPYSNVTSLYI
jgi:hypothetical protein